MPTRASKDHDFTTVARRVVEEIIGEQGDGSAAVALGQLGGFALCSSCAPRIY